MADWRDIAQLSADERADILELAGFGVIAVQALRMLSCDYEPAALAAKEASLAAEGAATREALLAREAAGEQVIWPLGNPAFRGTKPWLAGVPMRKGVDYDASLPAELLPA